MKWVNEQGYWSEERGAWIDVKYETHGPKTVLWFVLYYLKYSIYVLWPLALMCHYAHCPDTAVYIRKPKWARGDWAKPKKRSEYKRFNVP